MSTTAGEQTGNQLNRRQNRMVFILFITCLLVFSTISFVVVLQSRDAFDKYVLEYLSANQSAVLLTYIRIITFFGSSMFLLPAYTIFMSVLVVRRHSQDALALAITGASSWVLIFYIKRLFHRARPELPLLDQVTSFSFPSAHAFSSLVFFALLNFAALRAKLPLVARRWILSISICITLLVGLSRIILNVHYVTDVIGGYCLAIIWLIIAARVYRAVRKV